MSCLYDVAVVGAGPAGSFTASLLASAGHRVVVLEQQPADAICPRCTGVVGMPYVELAGVDDDLILARARSATFLSPGGSRMRVELPEVQACVVDRALLEKSLRRRASAAGAELRENVVVSRITRSARSIEVAGLHRGRMVIVLCRTLVVAAGVSPGLLWRIGLTPPSRHLVGAHAEVSMDGVAETEVHMLPDLAPGAFAWLVPVGASRVRVGVLAPAAAAMLARRFLERPGVKERVAQPLVRIEQRPVPVSVLRRTYQEGVVVVGDSAGHVKPTTGGGLYFGACAANAAADVLSSALKDDDVSTRALSSYEHRWRAAFGRELRQGALARGIYSRLSPSQVDRVIARAESTGLAESLLQAKSFSFDRHGATLLHGLLRCVPGLLGGNVGSPREKKG